MRVTSIQLAMSDQPKEKNVAHALMLVEQAPPSDLILLPEIWPCGFFSFNRYQGDSEAIDGPIVKEFQEAACKRRCHIFMGSMVENDNGRLYNTSILLNPEGQIAARYRKIHLFGYQSEETTLLEPGDNIVVVDTPWGKSGLSTCYDLRFPELYRRMIDRGAAFFLVASAWPHARLAAWKLFNRCRALENLAFLISCNCAGANQGKKYAGHSMIVDPLGQAVAEGTEEEDYVTADIDPGQVNSVRQEFPVLADRRLT
jgi:predicted amidohydrolase